MIDRNGIMLLIRLAAIALTVSGVSPALSQEPDGHVARLDVELAKDDYSALGDILFNPKSAEEARASLDWLGEHFKRGESPFIAFAYARLLMGFANEMPAEQAEGLKGTALAAMLYASSASLVEALQCADGTARSDRAQQFSAHLANSGLLDLDEKVREQAAWIAVTIEQQTWSARRMRNDARFLCANGMAAMTAGIQAGQAQERAPREGEVGRQIAVTPPANFVYERRADEEWWEDAEKLRAQLPALLAMLARVEGVPGSAEMQEQLSGE